ncbi:anthrone oxygenase family protein [Streptomyces sp. NPDC059076]|uniref:anthrone oxygenase family protein n=1 Tax=unclassified Streptomyces TaxID=2593676 RepID=UPI003681BA05
MNPLPTADQQPTRSARPRPRRTRIAGAVDMRVRLVQGLALLSTGTLAGAFGYGAANLVPTFNAVPLDMRLSFHSQLMQMNGITMQGAMGISALSAVVLAAMTHGHSRRLAGGAGLLALASFLITRLGNVPIKQWAATSAPADHAEILARWEAFNHARTGAAFAAFALLILLSLRGVEAGRSTAGRPQ